jgi:hypothetical protein
MGKRHREKPQRGSRRPAFLDPLTSLGRRLAGNPEGTRPSMGAAVDKLHDGRSVTAITGRRCDTLASKLFARLLLELPGHRQDIASAFRDRNGEQLARATHKLLGGVLYCDLPELAGALRELKQTLESGNADQTAAATGRAIRMIDDLLAGSGYRGK